MRRLRLLAPRLRMGFPAIWDRLREVQGLIPPRGMIIEHLTAAQEPDSRRWRYRCLACGQSRRLSSEHNAAAEAWTHAIDYPCKELELQYAAEQRQPEGEEWKQTELWSSTQTR